MTAEGPILVLGYGSRLRGDDAVGPLVAELVAELQLPGVEVLVRHQLTPELAEVLSQARAAVFVDASLGVVEVITRRIEPRPAHDIPVHRADPETLLALAQAVFGSCPQAWCVAVPVERLEIGEDLSPVAQVALPVAVEEVRRLCQVSATALPGSASALAKA